MASSVISRYFRHGLHLTKRADGLRWKSSFVSIHCHKRIKKVPNKRKRKDGHDVLSYNLYWEDRLQNVPKPPLWLEPPKSAAVKTAKKSGGLSITEKRIAATAVVSMLLAVISFKIVFGKKHEKSPLDSDTAAVTT